MRRLGVSKWLAVPDIVLALLDDDETNSEGRRCKHYAKLYQPSPSYPTLRSYVLYRLRSLMEKEDLAREFGARSRTSRDARCNVADCPHGQACNNQIHFRLANATVMTIVRRPRSNSRHGAVGRARGGEGAGW